jgi:hypothetical protein
MRFTKKEKELMVDHYCNDTKRQKTKFLWLPVTIDGETRWLETATIEYTVTYSEYSFPFCNRVYYWEPWNFINK